MPTIIVVVLFLIPCKICMEIFVLFQVLGVVTEYFPFIIWFAFIVIYCFVSFLNDLYGLLPSLSNRYTSNS